MADFMQGLMGMFTPGAEGIGALLGEEERKKIANQALMTTAMKLLASSGRSAQPVSLGQALGGAYLTGQEAMGQGVTNAAQNLLLKGKIDEMRAGTEMEKTLAGILTPGTTQAGPQPSPTITPQAALAMPGMPAGPTVDRANLIGQPSPAAQQPVSQDKAQADRYRQAAAVLSRKDPTRAKAYFDMAESLDPRPKAPSFGNAFVGEDGNQWVIDTSTGKPVNTGIKAQPKPETIPTGVREYEYAKTQGYAGSFEQWKRDMARAGAANVSLNAGQKGWENVSGLRKDFRGEPIYKTYEDMRDAYGQVQTALQQGTPIGDVAGATKMMKLLDPGSVVRESELGIAMAASGRMDRLQNYFKMWASGEKLTPTQRSEFMRLSNELMAATSSEYNKKLKEYQQMGSAYLGAEPTGLALGSPVSVPSIMKGGTAQSGQQRKPLGDIFGR